MNPALSADRQVRDSKRSSNKRRKGKISSIRHEQRRQGLVAEHRVSSLDYDSELQMHNQALRRTYGIRPRDQVLDIGCGAGQTTRDAGRLAMAGSALGIDIAVPMIERASRLTEAAGLRNVHFEQASAETYAFPREHFDVAISRFGTMFFAEPVATFARIRQALQLRGRLVMMVWREHKRNEWSVSLQRALKAEPKVPAALPQVSDPFSCFR